MIGGEVQRFPKAGGSRTTPAAVQGGAEIIGGEVQRFPRAGGSRPTSAAVGDESVIVTSVEQTAGSQVTTRSGTTARLQGQ